MSLTPKNIVVFGASGALGQAFVQLFKTHYPAAQVYPFSRQSAQYRVDYESEQSIANAAEIAAQNGSIDLVVVATGILHTEDISPEKSLKNLSAESLTQIFQANTVTPALIAKHFLPKLNKHQPSIFAVLSARVGSISDNRLGGWYAYRASKAALNMLVKTASIEMARTHKHAMVLGLHPGTVDSVLSKPFQKNVAPEKLFSAQFSVEKLWQVLQQQTPHDSGKCLAWDGQQILP
ncbi:short-chain alcohol dehydrogenase [Catenovulum agarivorans DS-2]|uniref:Short-chain alcohol dehydrogenase n=1 Tax=Catenovulum agarivorans DS-2 TaxID=1328313 RepID=W7QSF0_9ALTE|nr:SDR family NAD(P)-dependent oxidoreductase [Catenovulum agarivorans]EWH11952.1 short-chain alcohol dehydrogenase [Catenovulum agarivorans DS-2]